MDGTLHALTIVDGRMRLRALAAYARVGELAGRIAFALRGLVRGADDRAEPLTRALDGAARALDDLVLGPLTEVAGRPLIVSPTGCLQNLPWSVLPSCLERTVTVAPSATLWLATGRSPRVLTDATRPAVAVIAGPRLKGAAAEATAVAALHDTAPLLGDDATSTAALTALTYADLAHFAAHGRLAADNPLFSSLLLHDGPLMVHDLEQLPRTPRTVVLAACDGGRATVRPGDELLGLAAVLLGRGTAQVVAPVLEVPDAETTPFMVELHTRLSAGAAPAAALAASRQALAGSGPRSRATAALFVCIGRGLD